MKSTQQSGIEQELRRVSFPLFLGTWILSFPLLEFWLLGMRTWGLAMVGITNMQGLGNKGA